MYIMGNAEVQAVARVIESGVLFRYQSEKPSETDLLEQEFAAKLGSQHAVMVSSGTAALVCGLVGMGIGPGDEVIVPAYTFMATAMAPLLIGAIPVIAEIDESLTMDPEDAERKITPRTKALIPVHMNGLPCNMTALMKVARRHHLMVLEDTAQACGGRFQSCRLGTIGDVGTFSFNQFKIISCGEGGAVITNSAEIHQRALIYHDGGGIYDFHTSGHLPEITMPVFIGSNFRITEILSAILRIQLERLDDILTALRREKSALQAGLSDNSVFSFVPVNDPEGDCATTLALSFQTADQTERFVKALADSGVAAFSPITSKGHVFKYWESIVERRVHHPFDNPFRWASRQVEYTPDMCPQTIRILERVAFIPTSVKRSSDERQKLMELIRDLAARL